MRAVIVEQPGGPEVLVAVERPDPVPGPGQVVVRVAAAGVNFKDVYEREGRTRVATPFVPGSEGAGMIEAVGPGAAGFAVGERVAWWAAPGSYAELVTVPVNALVPVPDDIALTDAAAVLLQGLTAHYLVTCLLPAGEAVTALVHSAAGGLGQHLTRLLTARGVRVIGTVSAADKAQAAKEAGADTVLVRSEGTDLAAQVRELTGGTGVDVVYDGVGRDTFDAGLAALRRRGTFVLVGAASGPVPPFDPQNLAARGSLLLTRPTLVDYATEPAELRDRADEVFRWLRAGTLRAVVGGAYPLDGAARAHADLASRRTIGKLLLHPDLSSNRSTDPAAGA